MSKGKHEQEKIRSEEKLDKIQVEFQIAKSRVIFKKQSQRKDNIIPCTRLIS